MSLLLTILVILNFIIFAAVLQGKVAKSVDRFTFTLLLLLILFIVLQSLSIAGIPLVKTWIVFNLLCWGVTVYFIIKDQEIAGVKLLSFKSYFRQSIQQNWYLILYLIVTSSIVYYRGPIYWDEFFSWTKFPKIIFYDMGLMDRIPGFLSYVQLLPFLNGVIQFGASDFDLAIPGLITWLFVNLLIIRIGGNKSGFFVLSLSCLWLQSSLFTSSYLDGLLALSVFYVCKLTIDYLRNTEKKQHKKFGVLKIFVMVLFSGLIKPVGLIVVFFALFAVVSVYIILKVFQDEFRGISLGRKMSVLAGVFLLSALPVLILQKAKHVYVVNEPSISTSVKSPVLTIQNALTIDSPENRKAVEIAKSMLFNELKNWRGTILLLGIILFFMIFSQNREFVGNSLHIMFAAGLLATVANAIFLFIAYLVRFSDFEARIAASSERYLMHTWYILIGGGLLGALRVIESKIKPTRIFFLTGGAALLVFSLLAYKNGILKSSDRIALQANHYCTNSDSRNVQMIS